MLNLDIRVLLDTFTVSAGDTLTGTILLAPPRASPKTTLDSLTLTAKCEVRTGFTDSAGLYRTSVSHPYIISKSLIASPTALSSNEISIRFSLTLPLTSQPSSSPWSSSSRFSHHQSHPIPGSFADIIHHSLTVEAKTTSKLFSRSKREVPYIFLSTRSTQSPPMCLKTEHQPVRCQPSSSWSTKKFWSSAPNPSPSSLPANASLRVALPSQLTIGGPLSIRLSPGCLESQHSDSRNKLQLRSFELNLLARHHARAKVPSTRSDLTREVESEYTEKLDLFAVGESGQKREDGEWDATMPSTPITNDTQLEEFMEPNLLESTGVSPSFKTYNAALRYTLELKVVVGLGGGKEGAKRRSSLVFRRNVEVLPGTFKAAERVVESEGEELVWMSRRMANEEESEAPPAYCDPPPEYVVAGGMDVGRMLVSV